MKVASGNLEFECRQCGNCCRIENGIVRLNPHEISRIAEFLGKSESEFIDEDTAIAPDRRGLILKDGNSSSCSMLSPEGLCRIHPVKPDKCKSFPYEWTNPDSEQYCEGLKNCRANFQLQNNRKDKQ